MKIQHLEQTVSSGKIPKGVGTTGKWPRGADLCHTLTGALWTIVSETPFQPTNTLPVALNVHFWTYSKCPLGISGVPFSPNLIHSHSTLIWNIPRDIWKTFIQAHYFLRWLHLKHWWFILINSFNYIYIECHYCAYMLQILHLVIFCFHWLLSKLLNNLINITPSH